MEIKTYYSCAELVEMKLPGLPSSERRIRDRAEREKWPKRQRSAIGGGYEYNPPKAIMELIFRLSLTRQVKEGSHDQAGSIRKTFGAGHGEDESQSRQIAPNADGIGAHGRTVLPAETTSLGSLAGTADRSGLPATRGQSSEDHRSRQDLREYAGITGIRLSNAKDTNEEARRNNSLTEKQREIDGAIRAIINWVSASGLKVEDALELLNNGYADGSLHTDIAWALEHCHAKPRQNKRLNRNTYFKWLRRITLQGHAAPKKRQENLTIPAWGSLILKYYRRPQKPPLSRAIDAARSHWSGEFFSDAQAYRMVEKIKKYSPEILYRGRNQGAALKALLPYIRRNTENLWANDVWTGDGHSFKAKIAHPDHGRPFTPEVTLIADAASRKILGWSISYSENVIAVCDALRHAVSNHGLPLIYYSDNGAGQTARQLDAPITGMLGRLGIHHETGRPNSPQGRGLIERIWGTIMIPLARQFPTFSGHGADRDTLRRNTLDIEKALRRGETSRKLPGVDVLAEAIEKAIEWYNGQHKHSKLGTTPNEAYAERAREQDIVMLDQDELIDLFRPQEKRIARRGMVSLWRNIYFHRDLMLVDGQYVLVGYDIHDPHSVVVRRMSGEYICTAEWNANEQDYMPTSLRDRKRMERADRRIKRAEEIIYEAQAELEPLQTLEYQQNTQLPAVDLKQLASGEHVHIEAQQDSTNIEPLPPKSDRDRPFFRTDAEKYRWLMAHQSYWTKEDAKWLLAMVQTEYYIALEERFDMEGIAWTDGDAKFAEYKLNSEGTAAK